MFIDEKKRELMVLMINGFSGKDAKRYIYYDTIVLTVLGIIAGLVLGCIMGSITVGAIEPSTATFVKDIDWIEFLFKVPGEKWPKAERVAAIVEKKFGMRIVRAKSCNEIAKNYGKAFFELCNESYSNLYGFAPLTPKQIDQFVKMYLPVADKRLLCLVVDKDDNLVALGISIFSLAEALRKAKGRLFPFGWWHVLKALFIKQPKRLDFLLAAVKPEYQSKGAFALIFNELLGHYIDMGIVDIESNPELEDNKEMQNLWNDFEKEQHKRRRAFKKELV
jgi:hypothetical protein